MKTLEHKERVHFFWHGTLSKFEIRCIKSFINNGFETYLWSYNGLSVDGAISKDARLILPESDITKYKTTQLNIEGKPEDHANIAVFSDVFRIKLFTVEEDGWWADADCFCLKSADEYKKLRSNKDYVFSTEEFTVDLLGSSVFYFNRKTADIFWKEQSLLLERSNNVAKTFIDFGPFFFKDVCVKYKLYDGLVPSHTFYPVYWKNRHWLVLPSELENVKSEIQSSYCVHVWASTFKEYGFDKENPAIGSAMYNLFNSINLNTDKSSVQIDNNNNFVDRFIKINLLYGEILNRNADNDGLRFYIQSELSVEQIKEILLNSQEYKNVQNKTNR